MMRKILSMMLLMVVPPWLASTFAQVGEKECQVVEAEVVVVGDDGETADVSLDAPPGEEGKAHVFVFTAGEEGACCEHAATGDAEIHEIVIAAGGDEACCSGGEEGCEKAKKLKVIKRVGTGDGQERGWLGVSIGQTPEALAEQLDLEGRGVMILNVVKESPAERAGLKTHDVILSVGGQEASSDLGKVVDLVGSHKPGDEVEVVVLRHGEKETFTVELGSRAEMNKFVWIHEGDPLAEVEERITTRGKILRRGPDNEWIFEDLGDLGDLAGLSEKIKVLLPKSGSQSTQIFVDGNRQLIKTKVERDGAVIVVAQEDEGEITVTRVEDGKETTATYANEEELAAADADAYELFQSVGQSAGVHLNIEGVGDMDIDLDELHEHAEELRDDLHEHLDDAGNAYQSAIESAHEALRELMEQWQEHGSQGRGEPLFAPDLHQFGKPRHTFTVKEDGSIEARLRKGDSELVRVFTDEEDLAERNPRLYEKYQELLETEE